MYNTSTAPQENIFWGLTNGQYKLMKGTSVAFGYRELPSMDNMYEWRLQEMNIPYTLENGRCIICDPNCVEYEDYTAQVSKVKGFNVYSHFPPEEYTGKVPTERMYEMAVAYSESVYATMRAEDIAREKADFEQRFVSESKDGVSCWWNESEDFPANAMDSKYLLFDFSEPDHYFWGLVILKSAIKSPVITLKVPPMVVGRVIGKGGENARELARLLKIKYVKVEPVDYSSED